MNHDKSEVEVKPLREVVGDSVAMAPSEHSASGEACDSSLPLKDQVIAKLKTIFDPEIPVNIYELGLIYEVTVQDNNDIHIMMTLTTPGCPVAQTFPGEIERQVEDIEQAGKTTVELVWDPPWTQDRMSEAAKLTLGFL